MSGLWGYARDRVANIRTLISQVKSSSGTTRPRGDHPGPAASCNFLPAPPPYMGYGDLIGVGRRRNLSEAACQRNWPRSS